MYILYYISFMKERLKQIRLERGLPIREVAAALDMTVSAYAHYEQGRREPSIEILKRICKYFDVSADYLLGLTEY
jgi:DNA-binding helix-turn-helix protein